MLANTTADVIAGAATKDVVILHWPEQADRIGDLERLGIPRLLLVEPDTAPPPSTSCIEDWLRLPVDDASLRARLVALAAHARRHPMVPSLDELGQLSHRGETVFLSITDQRIAQVLIESFGHVVSEETLLEKLVPTDATTRRCASTCRVCAGASLRSAWLSRACAVTAISCSPRSVRPRSSSSVRDDLRMTWDGDAYQARFDALVAGGVDVHGEATFVLALAPLPASVLDAGCGTGRVAIELARHEIFVVGVDTDASMLAAARRSVPRSNGSSTTSPSSISVAPSTR